AVLDTGRGAAFIYIPQPFSVSAVVDARPVDGAHAHRTRRAVDIYFAALQHARALRHRIGRVYLARDHVEHGASTVAAAEQRLGIEAVRCVDDRGDLGMEHRTSGEKDAVLTTPDDLAVLHDHGPEWPAPALLDR